MYPLVPSPQLNAGGPSGIIEDPRVVVGMLMKPDLVQKRGEQEQRLIEQLVSLFHKKDVEVTTLSQVRRKQSR